MKDFINSINTYENFVSPTKSYALATVISIEGSSFRRSGLRMLITADGEWMHEEIKGFLQGNLLVQIQAAITGKQPIIVSIDTASKEGFDVGIALGYRGIIQLFINPKIRRHIETLRACLAEVDSKILMTILVADKKTSLAPGDMLVYKNDTQFLDEFRNTPFVKQMISIAHQIWERGRSDTPIIELDGNKIKLFCEIITPQPTLVLFGSQYDIPPFATIAKSIGWKVFIVANPKKLRKSTSSLVDKVIALEDIDQIQINKYTAFVIMSHLFDRDMNHLRDALKTTVPYIGMLGPPRRFERMFTKLAEQGFYLKEEDKARLHASMGLDTGAATQEEMAVSIIAEVRAFLNNKKGGFLKDHNGDIHFR